MGIHNNGRKFAWEKYESMFEYVSKYILPNKDTLILLRSKELKARRSHAAAYQKVKLQQYKIENAYKDLDKFKK